MSPTASGSTRIKTIERKAKARAKLEARYDSVLGLAEDDGLAR